MASRSYVDGAPRAMDTCGPEVTMLSFLDKAADMNCERDETEEFEQVETGQFSKWDSM